MSEATDSENVSTASADRLPIDYLRLVFSRVSARDLSIAACVCRLWNQLTQDYWHDKIKQRWKHGSSRWAELVERKVWRQIYRERHLLDCATRAALADTPWPVRREGAMATLMAAGSDALDELVAAAAPLDANSTTSATTATTAGEQRSAFQPLGWRYWAEYALAALRKRQAMQTLTQIATNPRVGLEVPELGAIAIAQAHYPSADLSALHSELAALGTELARRMTAAGAPRGSLTALHTLNHLLFGPPAPNPTYRLASQLLTLAGPQGGLGLRGCEPSDYYNPANSLLPDVLSRRVGIPISLALLQQTVAARGGLGGRLELIGLPSRVVNRFIPSSEQDSAEGTGGASRSNSADGSDRGGGGGGTGGGSSPSINETAREVFVDVFDGGTLLSWRELRQRMAGLGVVVDRGDARALSPAKTCERMITNMLLIYRDLADVQCLRLSVHLLGAVAEQPSGPLSQRYSMSTALEDWADAAECLEAMEKAAAGGGPEGLSVWHAMSLYVRHRRRELEDLRSEWQARSVQQKHRPASVLYGVGTMMQHRAHGYRGVIADWDTNCKMDEEWISRMAVDALPGGGRQQPFYRVLVSDRQERRGQGRGRQQGQRQGEGEGQRQGEGEQEGYSPRQQRPRGDGGGDEAAPGEGGVERRPVWRAVGPGSQLRGLMHQRSKAEETYVAQINIQPLVPSNPPQHHHQHKQSSYTARATSYTQYGTQPPQRTTEAAGTAAGAGTAAAGASDGASSTASSSPPKPPRAPPPPIGPYRHLQATGAQVVEIAVPYDYQIQHPELGRYFDGKAPGAHRYRLNAAMRHRFPGDVADDWDDWVGGADGRGEGGVGRGEAGGSGGRGGEWCFAWPEDEPVLGGGVAGGAGADEGAVGEWLEAAAVGAVGVEAAPAGPED